MNPQEALSMLMDSVGSRNPAEGKWSSFRCPSHGGKSMTSGYASIQNGVFIAKCFNGCSMTEILTSVGIDIREIEQSKEGTQIKTKPKQSESPKRLSSTERHILETDTNTILKAYSSSECYEGVLADHLRAIEHARLDARTEHEIKHADITAGTQWRKEISNRDIKQDWSIWREHIALKEHACKPESLDGLVGLIFGSHTAPSVRKMRIGSNTIGFVYPLRYPKRSSPPFSWKAVWWEKSDTGEIIKKKKNMPGHSMMPYSIFVPNPRFEDKTFSDIVFLVEGEGDAVTLAGMGAKAAASGSKQRVPEAMTGLCQRLASSGRKNIRVVCIPDNDIGSGAKSFAEAQRLSKNDYGVDSSIINIGMLADVSEGVKKPKDVRDFAIMFGLDEMRNTLRSNL